MANVLIVYFNTEYPMRATIADHLYCFRRYSKDNCYYLNMAVASIPGYIEKIRPDIVIFHTRFIAQRWNLAQFAHLAERVMPLRDLDAVRVALPQDEFIHTDALCDFINRLDVNCVYSVAPPSEWPKIYDKIDRTKVKLFHVLTGYLDERTVRRIGQLVAHVSKRDIDIGYRAWRALPWLGRHGMLKTRLAEIFAAKAQDAGLAADISTRSEDTILGYKWYEFLLRCKYTIGVEGGASILDKTGAIRETTENYLAQHPQAAFEEVEKACFPGIDGNLQLFAISPRHLEACATRTCQILVSGEYNGILQADKHYISLDSDFSNIDAVMTQLADDNIRHRVVEQAYADIVETGKCSYRQFVSQVVDNALNCLSSRPQTRPHSIYHLRMLGAEKVADVAIIVYVLVKKALFRLFSPDIIRRLRRKLFNY